MQTEQAKAEIEAVETPVNNKKNGKRWLIVGAVVFLIAIGVFIYWLLGRGWESTDDAQVQGNLVPINARVSGYVDTINVDDNQLVNAGQLLVKLDQRDLLAKLHNAEATLALQTAQANAASKQVAVTEKTAPAGASQAGSAAQAAGASVASAESQIASSQAQALSAQANAEAAAQAVSAAQSDIVTAQAQIEAAQAGIRTAQANVESAQAQATKTAADAARFQQLYSRGAASKQQLDTAVAANTSAQAALAASKQGVGTANANLAQARAHKTSAQAGLRQAISRQSAAQALARQALAGVKTAQNALAGAQAQYTGARATASGAQTAPQQIAISQAQSQAANARILQAMSDIRNARLQLSYTEMIAPVNGVVSEKNVQLGQFVQPGQQLMAVVPLNDVWVIANFKETQIGKMKVGQEADISVDTYPGKTFRGRINSIGAATGAQFSLLPPENATGNFVKVVQRVPVKIVLDQPLPKGVVLRPGMSVTANVNTRSGRG